MVTFLQPKKELNLVYDVGMHKGEDTEYYLQKGYKVIAFEADPELIAECRIKFEDKIINGKLIIVEGAIVEFPLNCKGQSKTVKFFKNKDVSVWGTIVNDWALRNEYLGTSNEIIEVQAIDFSECLKRYGIPYYLKIDIEGMDLVCLRSLKDFVQKPDFISLESEMNSFNKLKEELKLLKSLGYAKFKAVNQADIMSQKEPPNTKQGFYIGHTFKYGSSGLFGSDLPAKWKTERQILCEYKRIFIGYFLFGNFGKLRRYRFGRLIIKIVNKFSVTTIPGWYDTHAIHSSALNKQK